MPDTWYSKGRAPEIAERRGSIRTPVTPPIYVNLGNSNGGLVFNISENGLALTAAMDMADESMLTMQILLPDSQGWIEAKGAIAWTGSSKKEGGVRFTGLTEEARSRLSNWIAAEASRWEFQGEKDAGFLGGGGEHAPENEELDFTRNAAWGPPAEKEAGTPLYERKETARERLKDSIFQEAPGGESGLAHELSEKGKRFVDISSVPPSNSSILEAATPAPIREKQGASAPANSDTGLSVPTVDLDKPNLRNAPVKPDRFLDQRDALEVTERRAESRTRISPPIYVSLDDANGGLAFNMSEDGLALTAGRSISSDDRMALRIQIPDSEGWVEVSGQLAWSSESGKTAGITFIGLSEDSRQRIRDWLATEIGEGSLPLEKKTHSEQHSVGDVPAETPMAPLPGILKANSAVEKRMLEAILAGDSGASLDTTSKFPISPQEQRELQEETVELARSPAEKVETLENSKLINSLEAPSPSAVQEDARPVLSHFAVPVMSRNELPASAGALDASGQPMPKRGEFRSKPRPIVHRTTSRIRTGRLMRLAAVVALSGATAAGIRWIAAQPGVRNEVIAFFAENRESANKPTKLKTTLPANKTRSDPAFREENSGPKTHELEPVPVQVRPSNTEKRPAPAHPQARDSERPARRSAAKDVLRAAESPLLKSPPARIPEPDVVATPTLPVENARNLVAESSAPHPTESSPAPAKSPSKDVATGTALADVKGKETPPPVAEPPRPAVAPTWSVSVSSDPYPSIRMPQETSSQKPASSRSLVIGHVISRVEPVYPEDAKHQGIEGAVKLHVVVGRDGSVQSVEPISGPGSLANAAMSAVRAWRYAQTLLGGQPVETEQDIVVKFRVAGPPISKN